MDSVLGRFIRNQFEIGLTFERTRECEGELFLICGFIIFGQKFAVESEESLFRSLGEELDAAFSWPSECRRHSKERDCEQHSSVHVMKGHALIHR